MPPASQAQLGPSFPSSHIGSFLFWCRGKRKGGITLTNPYRAVISSFYLNVLMHGPIPPRRSIWKVGVNVPWQAPAWGWPDDCIQGLTGQLWIPQEFHHLSESERTLAGFSFPSFVQAPVLLMESGGILSVKTSVAQPTLVMARESHMSPLSLTRHWKLKPVVSPIGLSSSLN